ncbi:hypothetical protein Fcan01_22096 [Folsomia candida]|uniref:Uncharacterized protein n=1 Tax=Folsomia candida TaxID=158441 RepID=A0A226DG95_FOLCA|nr:hypothetical protein Fcan01_22096 [Folsomia candida]
MHINRFINLTNHEKLVYKLQNNDENPLPRPAYLQFDSGSIQQPSPAILKIYVFPPHPHALVILHLAFSTRPPVSIPSSRRRTTPTLFFTWDSLHVIGICGGFWLVISCLTPPL